MTDLVKLRELASKATPGPWEAHDHLVFIPLFNKKYPEGQMRWCPSLTYEHHEAQVPNAAFIAAANPSAILELVAELREARAIVRMVGDDNVDADPRLTVSAMAYRAKWGK